MKEESTNVQDMQETPAIAKLPVSSSSFDWRNDEYNDIDDDFYDEEESNHEAENCHCGAYKYSNGRWLHVSDCCC